MPVQLAKTAFAMRMTGRLARLGLAQRVAHGCGSGFGPKSALRLSCWWWLRAGLGFEGTNGPPPLGGPIQRIDYNQSSAKYVSSVYSCTSV